MICIRINYMPSVSKAQQKFFGMVHAMQKGDLKKKGHAGEVAKKIEPSKAKAFASTKTKGLPKKVKKEGFSFGGTQDVVTPNELEESVMSEIHSLLKDPKDIGTVVGIAANTRMLDADKKNKIQKLLIPLLIMSLSTLAHLIRIL